MSSPKDTRDDNTSEYTSDNLENRLLRAEEFAHIGHWQFSIENKVLLSSDEMHRIYGYDPKTHQMTLDEGVAACHPEDIERVQRAFDAAIETASKIDYEHRIVRTDGKVRTIHAKTECELDAAGKVASLFGIIQDITERKESEVKLQEAKEEAEVANRAKSDLLANMSHELRTPLNAIILNAIIGFSDTMKEETFGPVGHDKYREYLNDINFSGHHLLDLINDILDVSAIEAGALELHEEAISVRKVVEAAIRLIMPRAKNGLITITSSVDSKLPAIYADERRVKQVMLNLLSNAVKFTPEGGAVSVSASPNDDGSISIVVSDDGMGMEKGEQVKALSAFGQVDSGLDRKHEGTGLGLPLTLGLMELHGGTLKIKSTKGCGTQIAVTFPKERVT